MYRLSHDEDKNKKNKKSSNSLFQRLLSAILSHTHGRNDFNVNAVRYNLAFKNRKLWCLGLHFHSGLIKAKCHSKVGRLQQEERMKNFDNCQKRMRCRRDQGPDQLYTAHSILSSFENTLAMFLSSPRGMNLIPSTTWKSKSVENCVHLHSKNIILLYFFIHEFKNIFLSTIFVKPLKLGNEVDVFQ